MIIEKHRQMSLAEYVKGSHSLKAKKEYADLIRRIDVLEAEVKRWQVQSNTHYMRVCELDKLLADE